MRVVAAVILLGLAIGRLGAATPAGYDHALAVVQASLNSQADALHAQVISSGPSPPLAAQQLLGPIHAVGGPGQTPILVNTAPLVAAIAADEAVKDPDAKADSLRALADQIGLLRQSLVTTGAESKSAETAASARAVLAAPEFASDPPPPPSLADRIAAWLDTLNKPRKPAPASTGPNINPSVVQGILYVIAAGAFAILVWVLVQAVGRREARARPLALDEAEAVLVEARDNNSLLALAEQQAKLGDYRRAFRLVYLASLVALDTDGILRFDRSKTNWEYLRALRASGQADVYAALTPLTREFDQVWYGFAPTSASQYAWALAQYAALKAVPAEAAAG